jgi:hypothetical protein
MVAASLGRKVGTWERREETKRNCNFNFSIEPNPYSKPRKLHVVFK